MYWGVLIAVLALMLLAFTTRLWWDQSFSHSLVYASLFSLILPFYEKIHTASLGISRFRFHSCTILSPKFAFLEHTIPSLFIKSFLICVNDKPFIFKLITDLVSPFLFLWLSSELILVKTKILKKKKNVKKKIRQKENYFPGQELKRKGWDENSFGRIFLYKIYFSQKKRKFSTNFRAS